QLCAPRRYARALPVRAKRATRNRVLLLAAGTPAYQDALGRIDRGRFGRLAGRSTRGRGGARDDARCASTCRTRRATPVFAHSAAPPDARSCRLHGVGAGAVPERVVAS